MIQTFSNFFVRGVGRGSGVLERSLETAEMLRGEEGDDEDRKPVCTYFGKKVLDRQSSPACQHQYHRHKMII